jgi:hypothetical protein
LQPPTEATRPGSSAYDIIGPTPFEKRFEPESRVAHTLEKGGWQIDPGTGRNDVVPKGNNQFVTSTGRAHFAQGENILHPVQEKQTF